MELEMNSLDWNENELDNELELEDMKRTKIHDFFGRDKISKIYHWEIGLMIDLNTQFTILRANNYIMINQSDVDNIKQTKYETSHCKYMKALRRQ